MSILDNIRNIVEQEQNDPTGQLADQLKNQAIAAILAGLGSPAWETYMRNFIDGGNNPQQLARLMAQDEAQNDPYMKESLAYLVANAVCGPDTVTTTLFKVEEDNILDNGL